VLHKNVLPDQLWELLIRMMKFEPLRDFFLVGGTALALRLGHRESVDLDLFTLETFDAEKLANSLAQELPTERVYHEPDTIRAVISGVKVDLLLHAYPLISQVELIDGIRVASLPDLAAMKLNAVSGRGLRKDFWDIAAMLRSYGLKDMLGFYREKYRSGDVWHLIRALDYFEDAEQDTTLVRSIWPYEWGEVKRIIKEAMETFVTERHI